MQHDFAEWLTLWLARSRHVFDVLVETAHAPSLSLLHRLKAYDVLCAFVDAISRAGSTNLDGASVCENLLTLYIDRHDSLKPKHNKRIFNALVGASTDHAIRNHVCSRLLRILFVDKDHLRARPALDGLSILLKTYRLPLAFVVATQTNPNVPTNISDTINNAQAFLLRLLPWFSRQETSHAAGNFISTYLDLLEDRSDATDQGRPPVWAEPLIQYASQCEFDYFVWRNYILPPILRRGGRDCWELLNLLNVSTSLTQAQTQEEPTASSQKLLLAFLQVGVQIGCVVVSGE